jgi:hypothetical protein
VAFSWRKSHLARLVSVKSRIENAVTAWKRTPEAQERRRAKHLPPEIAAETRNRFSKTHSNLQYGESRTRLEVSWFFLSWFSVISAGICADEDSMRNHVLNLPSYSYFGLARRIVALSTVCLLLAGCGGMVSSSRDLETKTAKTPHIAWVTPAAIPYSTALSAAQLNAAADVPGDFSYAPSQGTVLSAGTHTLSVTFTPTDATDYTTASASVTLAVNRATPVLSWAPPAAIPYGMALSAVPLDATADVPGAFAYAPSLSAVLPTGPHTLSVNFTPADTTNYSTASASSTLTVNQAAPVLNWTAPIAISYGTALSAAQLNASASVPGTFSYTPSFGTVLAAGSHTLSVTFNPTDASDYSSATASVTLKVNESAPVLSWTAPAAISYGTALSAAQLNASASVPGTFSYTPSLGTVLAAGSHTLSVTFNPTDASDYSSATASSTLTVNQSAPVLSWTAPAAISYGTALSAAQLNASASVPGVFSLCPIPGYRALCRFAYAFGHLQSDGRNELLQHHGQRDANGESSDAGFELDSPSRDSLWYGAERGTTECNRERAGHVRLHTFARHSACFRFPYAFASPSPRRTLRITPAPRPAWTLSVSESAPVLSWTAPAAISYGTALSAAQLNASASVPGTFSYTPSLGAVLSVGSHTLSVTFTPTDATDYSSATASVTLTVNELAPVLSWTAPAAISYGTALSASQLNASASVPGTFSLHTFVGGTVLSVGSHTLSVTFTPTDAMDYSSATASVTLIGQRIGSCAELGSPCRDSLWYGAERGTTECKRQRAGYVRLHSFAWHGSFRWYTYAFGHLHPDGRHGLRSHYSQRGVNGQSGDTTDHMGARRSDCRRHGPGSGSTQCNSHSPWQHGEADWQFSLYAGCGNHSNRVRRADAVRYVYSSGHG